MKSPSLICIAHQDHHTSMGLIFIDTLIIATPSRQTRKFYAQANMLLRNFRYCSDDVKCMLFRSYCTNMYCCSLWFNSTYSSIKKLKTSYNGVLPRLLLIVKPYSASEMFVTHGIPSFF